MRPRTGAETRQCVLPKVSRPVPGLLPVRQRRCRGEAPSLSLTLPLIPLLYPEGQGLPAGNSLYAHMPGALQRLPAAGPFFLPCFVLLPCGLPKESRESRECRQEILCDKEIAMAAAEQQVQGQRQAAPG